ncbi:sigma-E factor negative regulatory protein [Lysobacter sp. GX 14042]|uniref:sigma-E factor negative regulatory protein n=1 Tax=Lysobacter sp. GX 14042 TaxID=2907155 RepID=UPI001F34D55C|nr:sigma-E factor negative regulatory protein [Lysobacter sp. GX 14042]MCE7032438.1 sigma-E factor negative regulatory protein [Lysobacter sp. GX 14042]
MTGSDNPSERELLSALLDGELAGDARRFALRRLVHDRDWQLAAARWQLAGDAVRGQPLAPAPAGFADRVAAAVAAEAAIASAAAPVAGARTRRAGRARWIGGAALAASVAMVALFAVRSPLEPPGGGGLPAGGDHGVQLSQVPGNPAAGMTVAGLSAAEPAPEAADGMGALAAAAPLAAAALDAGRRDGSRRSRGQQQRAALRASRERGAQVQVAAVADAGPVPRPEEPLQVAMADRSTGDGPARPFTPADEIVSRPWPRALPALSGGHAFTAGFDAGPQTATPSFYPFEPRLPPELREQLGVLPSADEPVPRY